MSKLTNKTIVSSNQCWKNCPYLDNVNNVGCPKRQQTSKKHLFKGLICRVAQKSKFAFWINIILLDYVLFLFILQLLIGQGLFLGTTDSGISIYNALLAAVVPIIVLFVSVWGSLPCTKYYKK